MNTLGANCSPGFQNWPIGLADNRWAKEEGSNDKTHETKDVLEVTRRLKNGLLAENSAKEALK